MERQTKKSFRENYHFTINSVWTQRARKIITAMDIRNITFEENYVIIRRGSLLKTTNKKHHTGEVKFPHFPVKQKHMPSYCLTKYLDATKPRRDKIISLFITTIKPYKLISKETLAWWVKTTLKAAGIDVKLFTPHSTRSVSDSKAKLHVPIEAIWTRGWCSMQTFAKYYDKSISKENEFANSILNNEN